MINESTEVFIEENMQDESISIYLIQRFGNERSHYKFDGKNMTITTTQIGNGEFKPVEPLLKME